MELRQIHTFLEIYRQGSFLAAASSLALTQPALSRQISLLERELGKTLFHRSARGAHLTPDGERLLAAALDVEASVRRLKENAPAGISGKYTISCGGTIAAFVLPRVTVQIRKRFPGLLLRVVEGDARDTLRALTLGDAELGILSEEPPDRDIESQFFFADEIVPVVSRKHPLASRRRLRPQEIEKYEMIAHHAGSAVRLAVETRLRALKLRPQVTMELKSMESLIRTIETGAGVGFLSRLAVTPRMKILPVEELNCTRRFHFCWQRRSAAVQSLIELIAQTQLSQSQLSRPH